MPPASPPKLYNPRHPERTLLYQTIVEHYATWLELASAGQFDGQGDLRTPKAYVRKAFAKYLDCGIFAHGFARARCADCAHDYFVAFSCKGRGVCPSCNTRRMVETAAHLTDHVFPRLPVRQWVLSVPKRLRYFMQRDDDTDDQFSPRKVIEAKDMLAYKHSGFSVDTSVRIEAHDRAGLERLLRYCARPPFFLSVGFVVTAVDFSHSALDTAHALKLQRGMALLTQCVYLADFDVSPPPCPMQILGYSPSALSLHVVTMRFNIF